MKKPIIAITPQPDGGKFSVTDAYVNAIEKNGGIACMLGCNPGKENIPDIVKRFDGFLFAGGDDVDPDCYGEPVHPGCGEITPQRDALEIELYKEVARQNKPMFAICRGIQVVNVAAGGTLYQDIPSEFVREEGKPSLIHSQRTTSLQPTQYVNISKDSKIFGIFGETRVRVNTHHHQAVKELAPGFKITAFADDGIIEAIERDDLKYCVCVQWHPERLAPNYELQNNLFKSFIKACGKR